VILIVDNYDSFTYNLYQILASLGADVEVRRNDALTVEEALAMDPDAVVLSPGPGRPESSGVTLPLVRAAAAADIPVLGVCLGHQAIGMAFGATLDRAPAPMHGKLSSVHHDGNGVFRGLPNPIGAVRYHSLALVPDTVPAELAVTAWTEDGVVMGVRHRTLPVEGVQFHPESCLTEHGVDILKNFLEEVRSA
jgi:anthranilate synthase component 2